MSDQYKFKYFTNYLQCRLLFCTFTFLYFKQDSDGDHIPDHIDTDDDNDGIPDLQDPDHPNFDYLRDSDKVSYLQ